METEKTICCYNCNQIGHISRVCPDNNKIGTQELVALVERGDIKESCWYKKVKCYKCDQIRIFHLYVLKEKREEGRKEEGS